MKITLNNHTYDFEIKLGHYSQGRLAIQLIDLEDGICITKASVNMPDLPCEIGHCYIKDYSENEGIYSQLVKLGIISIAIRWVMGTEIPYVKFLTSTP